MEVRFLEVAQKELDEAVEYYNHESIGLGDQFLLEVLDCLQRVKQFPEAGHLFTTNSRRWRTRRFPYGIAYQILGSQILIVALAHLHRKPGYWLDRVGREDTSRR
jgi:plasmid stabilization system protein ParE